MVVEAVAALALVVVLIPPLVFGYLYFNEAQFRSFRVVNRKLLNIDK